MKKYRIELNIDYFSAICYLYSLAENILENHNSSEPEWCKIEKLFLQIKEKYAKLLDVPDIKKRRNRIFEAKPTELDRICASALYLAAQDKNSSSQINNNICDEIIATPDNNAYLFTDEAMKYWDRLKQEKFVDSNFMLLKTTTRQQAMYIADLFAEKLGIKNKWKVFEVFWGIKHLAQERHQMTDKGTSPKRSETIDNIFED